MSWWRRTDRLETAPALRWVVLDTETTGLDPRADRLLSIGAVVVTDGLLLLGSAFEATLQQAQPSTAANILVHRIPGTRQTTAEPPRQALLRWSAFADGAPLVAFHAAFDRAFVDRAMRAERLPRLTNRWFDLAHLLDAWVPEAADEARSLDDWTRRFGLANPARHHALGDAMATAQLLQIVLARAQAAGACTLRALAAHERAARWLRATRRQR